MKFSTLKCLGLSSLIGVGLMVAQSVSAQTASCEYVIDNNWGSGAVASIQITNTGTHVINGWEVHWQYERNTLNGSWNANIQGSNPYSATHLSWNGTIQPGHTASFGLQVETHGAAETPQVTGNICAGSSTSSTPNSSSAASSSSTAISSSSVVSSSSTVSSSSELSSSIPASSSSNSSQSALPDPGTLDSVALTRHMGIGWNLGNTLEAIGGETAWGNPLATQQLIDAVKAAGFDTLRLPVAWSKFSDPQNFIIETAWMDRVEEVVNYALNADMYVIMNIHWDGGWKQPTYAQQDYVNNRLAIMWNQIAMRFRDYDYRLLFAGTNEVMVDGDYGTPTYEYYTVQNSFNQTFVTTVRATGGNNADRHLVVQGFNTNIDHTINFAEIPTDTVTDRLMMEVHYYDPYNFTLNENSNITQWGNIATDPNATETWANESYVDYQFQRMKTHFVDRGYGVILGEYGVISRHQVSGHSVFRHYWNEYITRSSLEHWLVPVYWDNGYAGNGGFSLFDRHSGNPIEPELINAIINATP